MYGPLLEKLWAKLNGNYERTTAGWQHEALNTITGAPSQDYLCSRYTPEEIWSLLLEAH